MPHPFPPHWFKAQMSIEQYKSCSIALCYFSPASCYAFPSSIHLHLSIHLIMTHWLCSSINVTGQVSHTYKTTGKATVFHCCIFKESVSYLHVMIFLCIYILSFCPSTYPLEHNLNHPGVWWRRFNTHRTSSTLTVGAFHFISQNTMV